MIPSPLQLDTSFFTSIRFEACAEGCPGIERIEEAHEVFRHEEEPERWMVRLKVSQAATDNDCPSYSFDIEIIGVFRIADEYPEAKRHGLVHANGPAVLYGAVREMVAFLSGRGPHPQVLLSTVTFIDGIPVPPAEQTPGPESGPADKPLAQRAGAEKAT